MDDETAGLEDFFKPYRENTVGWDHKIETPYGTKPLIYADWIASGRLYKPIERKILEDLGPMVGNTHSEASETGRAMTIAYRFAQKAIKKHVNAAADDIIVTAETGMTGLVNKLQRMLGLRLPPKGILDLRRGLPRQRTDENGDDAPVVFITHMEHHSNHISWLETVCDVIVIPPGENLLVDPANLEKLLETYKTRTVKIGSFSAASNVTGIIPPYRELARIMHRHNGIAFVDFAASAPYVDIDMHPEGDPGGALDGIFFSPHKFLGGPGSSGVLVFNKALHRNLIPDNPGGGTVNWTNRWGERSYVTDIEAREDGGTPGFLQAIRAALSVGLKEKMGTGNMEIREDRLYRTAWEGLSAIDGVHILGTPKLADERRIGVISFFSETVHHNLMVRLLNDHYGIQVRGGCSCAGTYGHYLLNVPKTVSERITGLIDSGDLSQKPGWVRISLHPTMTDAELQTVLSAVGRIQNETAGLAADYEFNPATGEYNHRQQSETYQPQISKWFHID